MPNATRIRLGAVAVAVLAMCVAAGPSAATATQITLMLSGFHPADQPFHQGTCTAPAPLCPSGSWLGNGGGGRTFTCADGSGTFTAFFDGNLEHTQGLSGPWGITAGTGSF